MYLPISNIPHQYIREGFHGRDLMVVVGFLGSWAVFWRLFFLTFWQSLWLASSEDSNLCSGPLKMPATETGETSGRTTFRTRPKSPKDPEQPLDPGRESLREYIKDRRRF